MAGHEPSTPRTGSHVLRVWFPILVLLLAALVVAAVWAWPDADWPQERRVTYSTVAVFCVIAGMIAWVVLGSGWRWPLRVGVLAVVAGTTVASIRSVKFTGDMVPIVTFRWDQSPDEVLEAHRRRQAAAPAATEVQLAAERSGPYQEYRGPRRDGVIAGPPLARDWSATPPHELWRQPGGGGYAGFVVAGNLAVTLEQRRGEEVIVGYDTLTGRERWISSYPADFRETMGGPGPRATPTLHEGLVYSLGATGMLVCLDAATGITKWQVNILENNTNIPWGMSGAPLVYDDVVVVNPGSQTEATAGRALVALDRKTGKQVWAAGNHRASYASPMLATLAGRRQVVIFDAAGLGGHDAQTGEELWRYPWVTDHEINVAQPLVLDGNRVLISSGYGHGSTLLRVTLTEGRWRVDQLWENRALRCKFTSPVFHNGFIYGLDEGVLVCLDPETGMRQWKDGRYGHGQILLTHDLLLIFAEDGRLVLVEANPEAHRELASLKVFNDRKNWNPLALADGRAYLRNHLEMACIELSATDR